MQKLLLKEGDIQLLNSAVTACTLGQPEDYYGHQPSSASMAALALCA